MTDKLELKSSHEVIDTVSVANVDSIFQGKPTDPDILTVVMKGGRRLYCDEVCPVDSLQEEPVSKDYRERYKNIAQSDAFKSAYENKSLGEVMSVEGEEPVSEELLKELKGIVNIRECVAQGVPVIKIARHFANWQKAHLWKPADGDDLPEIDREVIALVQDYPDDKDHLRVAFAHRPPEYWDGKDIVTGKVTRNYPKTYDKGGWNIPNVILWLDLDIPKL